MIKQGTRVCWTGNRNVKGIVTAVSCRGYYMVRWDHMRVDEYATDSDLEVIVA